MENVDNLAEPAGRQAIPEYDAAGMLCSGSPKREHGLAPLSPCGPSLTLGVELPLDAFFSFGEGPTVRIRLAPAASQERTLRDVHWRGSPSLSLAPAIERAPATARCASGAADRKGRPGKLSPVSERHVGFAQQAQGWQRVSGRQCSPSDFYQIGVTKPFAVIEYRDNVGGDPDHKDAFLAGQCVPQDLRELAQNELAYAITFAWCIFGNRCIPPPS
jgi:hypothetical protein